MRSLRPAFSRNIGFIEENERHFQQRVLTPPSRALDLITLQATTSIRHEVIGDFDFARRIDEALYQLQQLQWRLDDIHELVRSAKAGAEPADNALRIADEIEANQKAPKPFVALAREFANSRKAPHNVGVDPRKEKNLTVPERGVLWGTEKFFVEAASAKQQCQEVIAEIDRQVKV